jgi:glycosyltransferase involved in cell wall biosynthesis
VIIPCYNCIDTLQEAFDSCLRQGVDSLEVVMVDDGSDDGTIDLIKKIADANKNVIVGFHKNNLGGGATRNTAVSLATNNIIFCLDSDDALPDNTLSKMLKVILEKKSDGVLIEKTIFFDSNDVKKIEIVKNKDVRKVTPVELSDVFKSDSGFLTKVNFMYTKNAFKICGGYPTHHGHDTQTFGHRFLVNGLRAYVCDDTGYLHRRYSKPSYFDREYRKGRLSLNAYLMYEDFLYLFSSEVREKIINYNIFLKNKLGKSNIEKMVIDEFNRLGEERFFIKDYKKYLNENGKTRYFSENLSNEEPSNIFCRSIYFEQDGKHTAAVNLLRTIANKYPRSKILKMKIDSKVTLLMHNGGRLGNQLWLMAALYSYCLERGYKFDVRCFFEYQQYFNIRSDSKISRLLGSTYSLLQNTLIPEEVLRDFFYMIFNPFTKILAGVKKNQVIFDRDEAKGENLKIFIYKIHKTITRIIKNMFYSITNHKQIPKPAYGKTQSDNITILLPPSSKKDPYVRGYSQTYFYGWLFRNPTGIIKYQKEIKLFFEPKKKIVDKINKEIQYARSKYKKLVGVHVRLGDCVNEFIDDDRIAYSENEVLKILKEYLVFSKNSPSDICFFICSDGKLNESTFSELNVIITSNNPVEDMWLLSMTDTIIGADSSFAVTASLFGNVPFIVFKRGIDWNYYLDKNGFFVNKYVKRFIY